MMFLKCGSTNSTDAARNPVAWHFAIADERHEIRAYRGIKQEIAVSDEPAAALNGDKVRDSRNLRCDLDLARVGVRVEKTEPKLTAKKGLSACKAPEGVNHRALRDG